MPDYSVLETAEFLGQVVKLRGWSPETWRWRLGRWRAFYEIDEAARVVALTALSRRRDAY